MARVAVIGGGVSGLATAYYLKRFAREKSLELETVLLEKENRIGGTIHTHRDGDFVVEGGPDCFLSEKPWALKLARELDMADRLKGTNEANKGTFILSGNRLHPLPEGVMLMVPTRIWPMATTGLISWPGKMRMAMDVFIPRRKDGREETLAEFVSRRLGREALDKIAEPLVAGVHAGTPETMSLRASFPRFQQLEDEYGSLIRGMLARMKQRNRMLREGEGPSWTMFVTFIDGLGELIERLKNKFGENEIQAGWRATEIRPRSSGGWVVETPDGQTIEADGVVSAAPAYVTADLVAETDSQLAEELRAIPYASTATVSMAFDEKDMPESTRGFGFVVPRAEKRKIMAATWTSRKFFHRAPENKALLRCFIGGAHQPDAVNYDDNRLVEDCLAELRQIAGLTASPLKTWVFKWPRSMPQTLVGHEARMERIRALLAKHERLEIAGGAYYGLGIPDCVHQGELAARRMLDSLA